MQGSLKNKMDKNTLEKRIKDLTPEEREITQHKGTEPPFTGLYYNHHENGSYLCKVCGKKLFTSESKFESGSGWPSFDRVANDQNISEKNDTSNNMNRTEVICSYCKSHLGHLFEDGPSETTGKRYCINSASLNFKKNDN